MSTRHLTPFELGIEGVDMKAVAGTMYKNPTPLDVRKDFAFTAVVGITNVGGGTVGDAKLTIQVLGKDLTTVVHEIDILESIDTKTVGNPVANPTSNRNVVKWGYGTTPTNKGGATIDATGAEVLALAENINIILEVVVANDGTSSVADVQLFLEFI